MPTELEIVAGVHYHAWAMMPAPYTFLDTGRTITQLHFVPAKQPFPDRGTARRHAVAMATPEYGKNGYMALKCDGGAGCPYLFEGWDDARLRGASGDSTDAFSKSGAKAMLTPYHKAEGAEDGQ